VDNRKEEVKKGEAILHLSITHVSPNRRIIRNREMIFDTFMYSRHIDPVFYFLLSRVLKALLMARSSSNMSMGFLIYAKAPASLALMRESIS